MNYRGAYQLPGAIYVRINTAPHIGSSAPRIGVRDIRRAYIERKEAHPHLHSLFLVIVSHRRTIHESLIAIIDPKCVA